MKPKTVFATLFLLAIAAVMAHGQTEPTMSAQTVPPPATATTTSGGVYYIAFRTSAHIARSGPEVFHQVSSDMLAYLTSHNVNVVSDPERGTIETTNAMSVESMTRLARHAGAQSVLLVTVDRPAAAWLKILVQAYDLDGKLLWEESADKKSGMNGGNAPQVVGERIQKKLEPHLGKQGLPVREVSANAAETKK